MLVNSLRTGILLSMMSDVVVVPKPGKNTYFSYRPISLLNVDAKLLTKIWALCLNLVITVLVHSGQSGFMPGRGTEINIRCFAIAAVSLSRC